MHTTPSRTAYVAIIYDFMFSRVRSEKQIRKDALMEISERPTLRHNFLASSWNVWSISSAILKMPENVLLLFLDRCQNRMENYGIIFHKTMVLCFSSRGKKKRWRRRREPAKRKINIVFFFVVIMPTFLGTEIPILWMCAWTINFFHLVGWERRQNVRPGLWNSSLINHLAFKYLHLSTKKDTSSFDNNNGFFAWKSAKIWHILFFTWSMCQQYCHGTHLSQPKLRVYLKNS